MATTHVEVLKTQRLRGIEDGQVLKVVKETKCFFWVQGFKGNTYKVSKQTQRIIDIDGAWLTRDKQPIVNL